MASIVNVRVNNIRPKYHTLKDWMDDDENMYIGRGGIVFINNERFPKIPSKWANPFKVSKKYTRESSLIEYENYIRKKIESDPLTYNLQELKNKNLGCWCHPKPCHGDVLIKLIDEYFYKA